MAALAKDRIPVNFEWQALISGTSLDRSQYIMNIHLATKSNFQLWTSMQSEKGSLVPTRGASSPGPPTRGGPGDEARGAHFISFIN